MKELTVEQIEMVQGGIDSALCTTLVVSGSSLAGGLGAAYFSGGPMFGAGATGGAFFGGFLAAMVCN